MLLEQGRAACLPVAICSFSKPMCIGYRAHGALLQVCRSLCRSAPWARIPRCCATCRSAPQRAIYTMLLEQGRAACLPVAICSFSKPMCIGYRAHGALLQVCVGVLVGARPSARFPRCNWSKEVLFLKANVHWLSRARRAPTGVCRSPCRSAPWARIPPIPIATRL